MSMTRAEAISRFEKQLHEAMVVLDSGFGTRPGENDLLYRKRKEMAEIALQALREQEARENPQPLTIEELRQMHGEPVWVAVCHRWGLVHVDDYGQLEGKPLVQVIDRGVVFARDIEKGHLHCYRHKPKEET